MTERILRLVASRHGRLDDAAADDHEGWNGSDGAAFEPDDGWAELRRELDRSRRFGHAFVLMRVPRTVPDGNGGMDVVGALRGRLRSVDSIWGARKEAFVLLPEADRDSAAALVARLRTEWPALLPGDLRIAAFPADGLTSGALVELLQQPSPAAEELPALDVALHHGLTSA